MPHETDEGQDPKIRYVSAVSDTLHGNGLWRGQLVHPQFGTVNEDNVPTGTSIEDVVASGDPITDTKGLGIRLFWRRPAGVVPHFFIRDDAYAEAMRTAYPAFHHAAVRVLAEHIRATGYEGLRRLVVCAAFPKQPFKIGRVRTEQTFCVNGTTYRPDIVVEHAEAGYPRIELEVVNRHPPEQERLEAAEVEGALVLCMGIYDTVQKHILNGASPRFVPRDDELLAMLCRLRFTDLQRRDSAARYSFHVVWRDQETVAYLRELGEVADSVAHRVRAWTKEVLRALPTLRDEDRTGVDPLLQPLLMRRARPYVEDVEEWAVSRVGAHFDRDGVVQVPELTNEVDKVLRDYAAVTDMPSGVRAAVTTFRRQRNDVNHALNALLDAAERVYEALLLRWERNAAHQRSVSLADVRRMRAEEVARAGRLRSVEALRRVLASARVIARGYAELVSVVNSLPAPDGPIRIHRRGERAGQIGRLFVPVNAADFREMAEHIKQRVRDFHSIPSCVQDAQLALSLIDTPASALPPDIATTVAVLAQALKNTPFPDESEIDALVANYAERTESRHVR